MAGELTWQAGELHDDEGRDRLMSDDESDQKPGPREGASIPEIELDIARTREQFKETLDAIEDKLSVPAHARRLKASVKRRLDDEVQVDRVRAGPRGRPNLDLESGCVLSLGCVYIIDSTTGRTKATSTNAVDEMMLIKGNGWWRVRGRVASRNPTPRIANTYQPSENPAVTTSVCLSR